MQYELGMVLSGGGARGLAHVGVLKALAEAGIEPQVLAGTSAGAIVAALCAGGYSAEEMLEFFIQKNPLRLSKLALAKPGVFDTEKVVADFLEYFPDNSFESLNKPIFLTATDLVEARAEIFAAGRLIPAMAPGTRGSEWVREIPDSRARGLPRPPAPISTAAWPSSRISLARSIPSWATTWWTSGGSWRVPAPPRRCCRSLPGRWRFSSTPCARTMYR